MVLPMAGDYTQRRTESEQNNRVIYPKESQRLTRSLRPGHPSNSPRHLDDLFTFFAFCSAYCFLGAFLVTGSFATPFTLISAKASLALKGYRRTDCCPVVVRETSTRRLLARTMTCKLLNIFWRSSELKSGFSCICCFTCSAFRASSLP